LAWHSLLALKMEEERAVLQDKLRRLEARLREVERLGDQLREIQELEGRQEDTEEVFGVLRLSFSMVEASPWTSDSESDQLSEDETDDPLLLLPPPDDFADPDPAVTCMIEELPYRPALSLRRPPACFPHPVFRQSLGGTARGCPWERHKPALPLLPDDIGSDGTGKPSEHCQPMAESPTLTKPLSLLWSGAWGNWPVWERGEKPADRRRQPRTGTVETRGGPLGPSDHPPGLSPTVWQRTQTGSRPWGGKPPDRRVELPDGGKPDQPRALGGARDRTALG
jgi:hypothetical protein